MSAPITEAHIALSNEVLFKHSSAPFFVGASALKAVAQLIADSEAKAISSLAMVAGGSADRNVSLRLENDQLRAEVERLRSDRDCEKRLRKDADEFRENAIERAQRAEVELAAERARLDWVFHNCKVTSDDFTVHDREDLGVAMKEHAK